MSTCLYTVEQKVMYIDTYEVEATTPEEAAQLVIEGSGDLICTEYSHIDNTYAGGIKAVYKDGVVLIEDPEEEDLS